MQTFYFSYAAPGEAFDAVAHRVNDEELVGLEIAQQEGDFAHLTVVIRNPRVGLLFGRLWCWLSAEDENGTLVPLFNGRIVGAPKRLGGDDERVEVEFIARPDDYTARKLSFAQSLMVLPFYDPIFDSTSQGQALNPDAVLEGYSALYHTDRVTLSISISDIITGEDGTLTFGEDALIFGALSLSYGRPPLYQMDVTVTGDWTQGGGDAIDLTAPILSAFGRARSQPYGGNTFSTLTADGLFGEWPKPNGNLGGGWQLSADSDIQSIAFAPPLLQHFTPNYQDISVLNFQPTVSPQKVVVHYQKQQPTAPGTSPSLAQNFIIPWDEVHADFAVHTYLLKKFGATISKAAARSEQLSFSLIADVQQIENAVDPETLTLTAHLDDTIDFNTQSSPTTPIIDPALPTYFQTDRGLLTFEHVLLRARAKLRDRARCVSVECEVPWDVAQSVTCRMSATINENSLPGGTATGKVTAYSLTADADNGQRAKITISCAVGHGGSVSATPGSAGYVEEDYVDPPYQVFSGNQLDLGVASGQIGLPISSAGIPTPAPGEIWFEDLQDVPLTAGDINLQTANADQVASCVIRNGFETQATAVLLEATRIGAADPIGVLRGLPTIMELQLLDLQGQNLHTQFTPTISQLKIPQGINLGAGPQA